MARKREKADQPAEVRPGDEAAVAAFSGLMGEEEAPPPFVSAEMKGRGAGKSRGNSSVPTSSKSRPRKTPAPPDVPSFPVAAPAEPTGDFSHQAREAGGQLDAIVQQCREARTQFQRELEERQGVDREVEALRQRSQAAHEQLLAQAREGAEQVKREHSSAAAQLTAAGQEVAKLIKEVKEGTALLKRECAAAATQVSEAGREVEALRLQSEAVREQLLVEARDGGEQVKQECATAAGRLAEASAEFTQTRQQFLRGFEEETRRLHLQLGEATQSIQAMPRQAEEARQRLTEAKAEVDDATLKAQKNLDTLQAEVADTEKQLAALRLELLESRQRLKVARQELEDAEDAPRDTAEAETRNHLGITVDPGVVVAEVTPGTPAAMAGLVRGDVIKSVDGIPVLTGPALRDLILHKTPGDELTLRLTRGGVSSDARVRLEAGDEKSPENNHLGATVDPVVVVAEVTPGTPGAAAGLLRGDIITAVNGVEVLTGAQLRQAVQALEGQAEVTLRFTRGGTPHEAKTRLDEVTATT